MPETQGNAVDEIDPQHVQGRAAVQRPRGAPARDAVVGPAHAVGRQRQGQHADADRPADRARTASRARSPTRTTSTSRRDGRPRDRRRRAPPAARLPRPAHAARSGIRRRCTARASTTWTSRPTAAARSRRASSPASSPSLDVRRERIVRYVAAARRRDAPGRAPEPGRALVLRRRHGQRRRLAGQRAHDASGRASSRPAPARTASCSAATRGGCSSPTAARARSRCWTSRTNQLVARWRIPGGGSPDMGGVSASGRVLWLSRPLEQRGLRDLDAHRPPAAPHPRRPRAARAVGLAAARALLAGAHRYVALSAARRGHLPAVRPARVRRAARAHARLRPRAAARLRG